MEPRFQTIHLQNERHAFEGFKCKYKRLNQKRHICVKEKNKNREFKKSIKSTKNCLFTFKKAQNQSQSQQATNELWHAKKLLKMFNLDTNISIKVDPSTQLQKLELRTSAP